MDDLSFSLSEFAIWMVILLPVMLTIALLRRSKAAPRDRRNAALPVRRDDV